MDYEKKYKEALERARKLYNDAKANEYESDMEDYESIFPELAESEDERIRRWLCDYFSSIDKAWIHKDITCIDILRWLEKQKEQKKEKFPPYVTGFKGHPETAGTSDLEEAAKEYADKHGFRVPYDGSNNYYDDVDIKASKEGFLAGAEWQKEQKPAEWSEEDEKIRKTLLDYYEKALDNYTCVEWLNGITYGELCDWLKSLRPSWKPSEEQMVALFDIIHPADTVNRSALESLYEQLKKLM